MSFLLAMKEVLEEKLKENIIIKWDETRNRIYDILRIMKGPDITMASSHMRSFRIYCLGNYIFDYSRAISPRKNGKLLFKNTHNLFLENNNVIETKKVRDSMLAPRNFGLRLFKNYSC